MPVPQYRAPKDSQPWGLLGAISRFLSPPGYTPSGPLAQASARVAASQAGSGFVLGRPAGATELPSAIAGAKRRVVPIMSDQLPPGAYMKETGEVIGMSSEQVPKGGYMTETGRVYVPAGFTGFSSESKQGPDVPDRIRFAPRPAILPSTLAVGATPIIQGTRDGVTPDRTQSDEYKAQMAQYGALQKAKKFEEAEKLGMEIWRDKYGKTPMAQPKGAVGAFNPLMQRTFGYQTGEQPGAQEKAFGVPQGFDVSGSFSIGANAVPAPWNTQGAAVSAPYQQAMQQAAGKTTGEGMPDFSTTIGSQVAEALGRPEYARFLSKK